MTPEHIRKRFVSKIDTTSSTTGCWLWIGTIAKATGYGYFTVRRKNYRAHRLSYELFKGPIPDGKLVCHSCDNPCCVNPDHLWIGDNRDNMLDRIKKGRANLPKGHQHWNAKLSDKEIEDIRVLRSQGMHMTKIAKRYGMHYNTIRAIFTGRRKG